MPTVKQTVGITIAMAMALVVATAFGISAIEYSVSQVPTNNFTPSKAEFGLNDHQQLRKLPSIERR